MNVDRFIDERQARWDELDELLAHSSTLTGERLLLLTDRYRQVTTDLSVAHTAGFGDPVVHRLAQLAGRSHAALYGRRKFDRRAIPRFFSVTFPAAVWWHRRFIVVSALLFFVPAVLIGAWMAVSPEAVAASAPESVRQAYLESDFESYYSSEPAAQFATEVFVNNIQVAILAFALGALLSLPTAWVLIQNGANIGLAAGLFTAAGRWEQFWGLITPHGLLEVAAIVVAGGAGLALGWSIVAPGDRTRAASVGEAGRRSVAVVVGLILAFLVAGLIEGFVTGSDLATGVRVGLGIIAFALFAGWVLVLGPRAARRGYSGVLGEDLPIG